MCCSYGGVLACISRIYAIYRKAFDDQPINEEANEEEVSTTGNPTSPVTDKVGFKGKVSQPCIDFSEAIDSHLGLVTLRIGSNPRCMSEPRVPA